MWEERENRRRGSGRKAREIQVEGVGFWVLFILFYFFSLILEMDWAMFVLGFSSQLQFLFFITFFNIFNFSAKMNKTQIKILK